MQKIGVSARIPPYVKEYFKKNNISLSKALMFAFEKFREGDMDFCMKKLQKSEENVLHWRQKVLHLTTECNTKQHECNTIRETFIRLGRGNIDPGTVKADKSWLEPKVEDLQKRGVNVTLDELYSFCISDQGDGK